MGRVASELRLQVWDDAGETQTGWALLRASLHDPLLVINAESDNKGGAGPGQCLAFGTLLFVCALANAVQRR